MCGWLWQGGCKRLAVSRWQRLRLSLWAGAAAAVPQQARVCHSPRVHAPVCRAPVLLRHLNTHIYTHPSLKSSCNCPAALPAVVPRESSHFGFYNGTALLAMADTDLYREDWIGLRALDEGGRLHLEHCPGGHMHFSLAWFEQAVVLPYLAVRGAAGSTAAAGSVAGVGAAVR